MSKISKKKSDTDVFEKEIADISAELSVKTITMDQLKDESKELEEKLSINKTAMKSLKDSIKELAEKVDALKKKQALAKEKEQKEKEQEEKLRKEIEMKIREEHEIKKKVDEELQRIKSIAKTEKPEVKKKAKEQKEQKEQKEELDPGSSAAAVDSGLSTSAAEVITKRKAIPKAVKSTLWNIHFTENNAKGECKVCNKEIKMTDFDAGHIIAVANGGSNNLDNLMPVCSLCNKSMGVQNLNEFKKLYFDTVTVLP
jgi:5-methylcytosine-specific restriction endonuclease McrA